MNEKQREIAMQRLEAAHRRMADLEQEILEAVQECWDARKEVQAIENEFPELRYRGINQ